MRTKLLCLLVALVLLPGCRSAKEFFFPSPTQNTEPAIYETTQKRQFQEGYEDRQNHIIWEERKGDDGPVLYGVSADCEP